MDATASPIPASPNNIASMSAPSSRRRWSGCGSRAVKGGALKPSSLLAAGRVLGEVEEWFIEQLLPGDSFAFAGEVLRFEGLRETDAIVTRSQVQEPKVPSYDGGKFPLSTYLADRVRRLLADEDHWKRLPEQVSDWLRLQSEVSVVPGPDEILVETFPRGRKHYLVCYPFEGRLAHQSLGMLLTRRLERRTRRPLGFVANEYALAIWGLGDMGEMVTQRAARPRHSCSTRTCSATISMPGSPNRA